MTDDVKYPDVHVTLVGEDGNAFAILGRVRRALVREVDEDAADAYYTEATSGDYDHLLRVTMLTVVVD